MTASLVTPQAILQRLQYDLSRGTSELPALPRSVTEALRLAQTPSVDFDEVAAVASQDPPLAARVVSVANSALYARSGMPKIASVRHAAVRLGAQATRDVLYQVAYSSMFADAESFRELIEGSFEHGVRTGRHARSLARELRVDTDVAFLAGLLHDVGRARCWRIVSRWRMAIDRAVAVSAVDQLHLMAGSELAAKWHLPDEVVEVCRWHHDPGTRLYSRVVAAADELAHLAEGRTQGEVVWDRLVVAGVAEARAHQLLSRPSGESDLS